MRAPRRGLTDSLSVSALDLFASALGVFVVMFIILMPFYLKQPSTELGLQGALSRLSGAQEQLSRAQEAESDAQATLTREAEKHAGLTAARDARRAELAALLEEIERAQSSAAAAEKPETAPSPAPAAGGGTIAIERLDLVIVMDTTGSMRDELRDIQANLESLARILNRLSPNLRLGFVAYRDRDRPPILRQFPLAPMGAGNLQRILQFTRTLRAEGGGDRPEPVGQAMGAAIDMRWRNDANGRIIIIGDAPAHGGSQSRSFAAARAFAESGPGDGYDRRVSAIITGQQPDTKAYFRQLVEAGGGDLSTHRGAIMESVLLAVLE